MLPTVRWMEAREFWTPDDEQMSGAIEMLEEYFSRGDDVLRTESRLRLLLLSLAYLRSGTALRIARYLDEAHPDFAQRMVDAIRADLATPNENATRIGSHVMASRIKHLSTVKVLSKVFAKERLKVIRDAVAALNSEERSA